MDKVIQPESHMYFCTCTNVYIKKEEIPGHLILPHNHKITSFMIASSQRTNMSNHHFRNPNPSTTVI